VIGRRDFLRIFSLAAAGAAALPSLEKLVEVATVEGTPLTLAEADLAVRAYMDATADVFFRHAPVLAYMKAKIREHGYQAYQMDWQEAK
jgi:hypothetical protein